MKWGWDKIRFNENVPFNPWLPFMKAIRSEQWSFIWQRKDLIKWTKKQETLPPNHDFHFFTFENFFFVQTLVYGLIKTTIPNSLQVTITCFRVWMSHWNHNVDQNQTYDKEEARLFLCHFQHQGQSHSVIFVHTALKTPVQSNHQSSDEYIYIYIYPSLTCNVARLLTDTRKHTPEAKSLFPFLVRNNYPSDRSVQLSDHIIIPALPYLLWRLN